MHKYRISHFIWGVAFFNCTPIARAQPQNQPAPPHEQLITEPERKERLQAFANIGRQHGESVNYLLKHLAALSKEPDKNYGSSFYLTVTLLGRWREEAAIDHLLPLIDFRLDMKTVPAGMFQGPDLEYPVAAALKNIGGKRVVDEIFQRLAAEHASEHTLRLNGWILEGALGRETVHLLAQSKINLLENSIYADIKTHSDTKSEIEAKSATRQVLDHNPEKRNLEELKHLLNSKEPLLR